MLLTVFYMVSTWVQAWKLSSLKARFTAVLNIGLDTTKPSIMFHIKPPDFIKDEKDDKKSDNHDDLLSSHLCSNKSIAKLGDLLWCQGDKRLCTIYPLQKIDVNEWLLYVPGQWNFPLYMNISKTIEQPKILDDTKMHVLIEADIENYCPNAFFELTKLENYGHAVAWTVDKVFAIIIETDIDHLIKLSIALMQNQCYINNGMILKRIESVTITGKPCSYNIGKSIVLCDKRLVGKAQWQEHINKLKIFSSTARHVAQNGTSFEIDTLPGIIIHPGCQLVSLQQPVVLKIDTSMIILMMNLINHKQCCKIDEPSIPPPTTPSSSQKNKNSSNTATPQKPPRKQLSILKDKKFDSFDKTIKPPNVLIYADNTIAKENIKKVLELSLNMDKYTIYELSSNDAKKDIWIDQTNLLIICGNVDGEIANQIIEYIIKGGKILTLCSDALKYILPSFKTAEVREHELVRFSYGKWKNVQLMHHIFCYQASPTKLRSFSQDQEDYKIQKLPKEKTNIPVSENLRDKNGKIHNFHIEVLGTEETWHTPSIVLADLSNSGGKIVFSQIHLEADPSQYECEEIKYQTLKQSNTARLEILSDLLSVHLSMDVNKNLHEEPIFESGFFLGRHEFKLRMLDNLKNKIKDNNILQMKKLQLQFCSGNDKIIKASSNILPIMIHQCPDNFSTIDYFENLKTKELGRLVIYANIMTSSMDVVNGCQLEHGLVVIPRRQTQGQGRGKNIWLSPIGCAMFTIQIHIPINSYIGCHLPILQNLVSVAIISAVKTLPGYENIDLRIKWPNDIYAGNQIKLGGLVVTTLIESKKAICNIGVGVNLSNDYPTSSLNNIIDKHNKKYNKNLSHISYEKFFALIFTELENIIDKVQNNNIDYFNDLYYEYWIHTDADISVVSKNGDIENVKIRGIDDFGFLQVEKNNGTIMTVHPDGNSFDIIKGLIVPSMER
ncbi:hypothetical protein HCN44_008438 [Aphidius gifuensis]|uniref:BPL/LPL catalytic domain-containing protein n=1 Tax=Aphidius gifuensis TaxID=684658 RepID=A0A835CNQ4_APHGI|nr:biotin--protein ligase [Aphidius gifuensis]KAF7989764.1 hypothetical protein HCN44_008438 [Aphidius gifuensis]